MDIIVVSSRQTGALPVLRLLPYHWWGLLITPRTVNNQDGRSPLESHGFTSEALRPFGPLLLYPSFLPHCPRVEALNPPPFGSVKLGDLILHQAKT